MHAVWSAGAFTFYEDECGSYCYKKGVHATTSIHWDDTARTLTLDDRNGSYPGMPRDHTFNVVVVSSGHGVGPDPTAAPDKTNHYTGSRIEAKF